MKLRDRRVLRLLEEKGLQDAEVFHGPQKVWWTIAAMALVIGGSTVAPLFLWMTWYYIVLLVLLYLFAGFVISGRYFNSIVVTATELIIINPNFLFKKYTAFPLDEIRLVIMGTQRSLLATFFFLQDANYIEVGTDDGLQLFYCMGLDEHDGYLEEGLTEKTLEDLALMLKRKHIAVQTTFEA